MKMLVMVLLLSGCVTRQQVEADIWLVRSIPANECPTLTRKHGFFRKVICKSRDQHPLCKNGDDYYVERISFCADRAEKMVAMDINDAEKWLKMLTTPRREK